MMMYDNMYVKTRKAGRTMRVISGKYKGRILKNPEDNAIRPTSDKVKEAMFNMIQGYTENAVCADIFCGTGALGIEALSRGAKRCYFCDISKKSSALTAHNITLCGVQERAFVKTADFRKFLKNAGEKLDIVFIDPPYSNGLIDKTFESISENDVMNEYGIIIAEHTKEEVLQEEYFRIVKIKEKKHGQSVISVYENRGAFNRCS